MCIFNKKDVLFRDESNCVEGAWLKTRAPKLSTYTEGYEIVLTNILKMFKEKTMNNNIIVYPIVYMARHYIELRIKELYALGMHYINKTSQEIDIDDFKNGHKIYSLWEMYDNDVLSNIREIQNGESIDVKRILKEFKNEDENGETYRYPFDKSEKNRNELIKRDTLDIKNFEIIIMKLKKYFIWHSEILYALIDKNKLSVNSEEYY